MFKKITLTAFVISAVMLAACGNSNTSTNVTTAPTTAEITTTTSPPVTDVTTTTVATEVTTTTTTPTTVEQTTITTATDEEPFFNADGSVNKNRWHYCEDIEQEILDEYNKYRAENNLPCNYTQNEAWASYADRLVYYMSEYMQLQHSMSVMEVISSTHYTTGSDVLQGFVNSPKHNDLLLGVSNGYHFDIDYVAVSSYSGHLLYTVIILEDETFEEYFWNVEIVLVTEHWFENKFTLTEEAYRKIEAMSDDEQYNVFIEKGYDKYYPHLVR